MSSSLIRRAKLFDFYARHCWRFHRLLVRKHLSERCRSCAISSAHSQLVNGVCGECAAARRPSSDDTGIAEVLAARMDLLFSSHQGKGAGAYDALVMLSGGKDSALLLHELQRRYPRLRLLALTIDNGFMSPIALENCRRIVDRLDVDHVVLKPARSLYAKSFRFACLQADARRGAFETLDRIDADLGLSLAKIYAAEQNIPLLLTGLSWKQVELLFGVASFEVPREQSLAKVESTLGTNLTELYSGAELRHWWDPARYPSDRHPAFLHPFYVWRYDEATICKRVRELGLIEPGHDSPLLTNQQLIPLMVAADFRRMGYASFEPEFAAQVRVGKADRVQWRNVFEMLEYSAKTGWMLAKEFRQLADSIGLDPSDLGLGKNSKSRLQPASAAR